MQNARIDLPPGSRLQLVGSRVIQNAVVALIPALQAAPQSSLRRARLQPHERVREIVVLEVVLRREIVRFRLALLPHARGEFIVLVQVMRDRPQVVEELAQQVPAAISLHTSGAKKLVAHGLDRLFEQTLSCRETRCSSALRLPRSAGRWRPWWSRRTSVRRCRRDARRDA